MAVVALAATAMMDEEALGRLLWEESELNAGEDLLPFSEDEEEEEKGRRGLMIFSMAGILIVPVLLGLGAGGGLPPTVQNRVRDVVDAAGVQPAERAPAAQPVAAAAQPKPAAGARSTSSERTAGASTGDGSRGRQRSTLGSAGAVKHSTAPKAKPAAVKKTAKKAAKKAGGGGSRTTTAPVVKPKGNKNVAPGKVKKSATTSVVSSPPTTTTPPKGKAKKP
jgi:hypothetical protein